MGFLSGTKRAGSLRLPGVVCAVLVASVLAACQSSESVRSKPVAAAGPTVPADPHPPVPVLAAPRWPTQTVSDSGDGSARHPLREFPLFPG